MPDLVDRLKSWSVRKLGGVPKVNTVELMDSPSSGMLSKYIDYEENPDDILLKESRGLGYKIYDEMLWKDPHIKSCTDTRFRTAASRIWSITPHDDSDEAVKTAQFVELVLQRIPQFSEILRRSLGGAVWKGFSVGELIWEVSDSGLVLIKDIKDRHQNRFRFSKTGTLQYQADEYSAIWKDADPMKFFLMQYNCEAGSNYGTGLARSAYWYYTFKRGALRQWVLATERYSAPTALIRHDDNIDSSVKSKIKAVAHKITSLASLTVSKDVEIELLEAQRRTDSPYVPMIEVCNMENSKLILGGTLSNEGGKNGTQALGTVHENVRDDILAADCEFIMHHINSQLIPWIVDFNIVNVTGYPLFSMQYEPPKDRKAIIEVVTGAVNLGLEVAKDDLRDQLSIRKPGEDEEVLTAPSPKLPSAPQAQITDNGPNPDANADDKLSLNIGVSTLLRIINSVQNNSLAAKLGGMFQFSQPNDDSFTIPNEGASDIAFSHYDDNLDGPTLLSMAAKYTKEQERIRGKREFVIKEDPARFLPNLPPKPKPVEGQAMPVYPDESLERYNIGSIAVHQSKFRQKLIKLYSQAVTGWLAEFGETPRDISGVIDDFVESQFKNKLRGAISTANREMVRTAAKDIAKKLGMSFNRNVFENLATEYLRVHAYDRGIIDGVAETTKRIFSTKFADVLESGDDAATMVNLLKSELPALTDYQASRIAVTELRQAANWTVLEMGKRSDLDLEAWFITDPQSCPVCQDVAAGNPYTLQAAQNINTPHPNCGDMWIMTKRGQV